jgi:hypothetical protein
MNSALKVLLDQRDNDRKELEYRVLGSDLEVGTNRDTGWLAILGSNTKPTGKATVYKIPHHGSQNADLDGVWSEMLIPDPIAILTPFRRGNVSLPKPLITIPNPHRSSVVIHSNNPNNLTIL